MHLTMIYKITYEEMDDLKYEWSLHIETMERKDNFTVKQRILLDAYISVPQKICVFIFEKNHEV